VSVLLTEPPKRFGQAEVVFGGKAENDLPWREGSRITFPGRFDRLEMYSLMEGHQFLASIGRHVIFGGTDEAPFLVLLEPENLRHLTEGGEAMFYAGLKPYQMNGYEAIYGGQAVRQGDIWALALPMSWDEIARYYFRSTRGKQLHLSHGRTAILRTRHVLEGTWATERPGLPYQPPGSYKYYRRHWPVRSDVVDGILEAPDHAPLGLDGPHVLVRTDAIAGVRRRGTRDRLRGED
jgi:hypothetical protein